VLLGPSIASAIRETTPWAHCRKQRHPYGEPQKRPPRWGSWLHGYPRTQPDTPHLLLTSGADDTN
jgi:hypothetical protein